MLIVSDEEIAESTPDHQRNVQTSLPHINTELDTQTKDTLILHSNTDTLPIFETALRASDDDTDQQLLSHFNSNQKPEKRDLIIHDADARKFADRLSRREKNESNQTELFSLTKEPNQDESHILAGVHSSWADKVGIIPN